MNILQTIKRFVPGLSPVVTRVAPSPTGELHVGTARTALFNFLWARRYGGTFILRIEDTDRERSKEAYENDIYDQLHWLGIEWDTCYRQSERTEIYQNAIQKLLKADAAYRSQEESKSEPGTMVEVIRLRNPGTQVTFTDTVRGKVTFDTAELGDFVVARSETEPLYHLAVVVDDEEMGVTDIIRGEDHISNTPRQILIQNALGYSQPRYAHIPLIMASDKSKLSKRTGGATIAEYQRGGYLPEALINHLALLGWNPGDDDREFFTLSELTKEFTLSGIQKGGAVFNENKLAWFNKRYMHQLSDADFMHCTQQWLPESIQSLPGYSVDILRRVVPALRERITAFGDLETLAEQGELTYYFTRPEYSPEFLVWKDSDCETTHIHLEYIINTLKDTKESAFTESELKNILWDYASESGRGAVLWPMRYALSGVRKSPDPFTLAAILGKEETIERLTEAQEKLRRVCEPPKKK